LLERLASAGVRVEEPRDASVSREFQGMQFVLTGSLDTLTRDQAKAAIEGRGGRVTGSVSKKTSVVVVGQDAGSKLDKARELGVAIWDEPTLRSKLGLS
jgi:DNA ligase (NAD+)